MRKTIKSTFSALAFAVMFICLMSVTAFAAGGDTKWITAWGTAPTEIGVNGYQNITALVGNVTSRTVLTPSASGSKLRINVSNVFGKKPLKLTRVTVAKVAQGSSIDTDTVKMVTFNEGQPFVTVPAGEEYRSDAVTMDVKAGEQIAVSIYIENFTEVKTMGLSGGETYLALGGDYTVKESVDVGQMIDSEELMEYLTKITGESIDFKLAFSFVKVVPCLASVEVLSSGSAYSVVVVGDSTVSNEFPEYLGDAVIDEGISNVGVVGKGIIGNRLLGDGLGYGSLIFGQSLLDRFERDVLNQTGIKYAVIKIGANDIIHPVCKDIQEKYPGIKQPTSKQIIAGYKKLFEMCHDAGIKVVVMSITPWKGSTRDYFGTEPKYVRTDEEFEADWQIAKSVNSWLSKTDLHDGYINLNKYSANPMDTAAFMPEYTIDGIHPSDSMQRIWAQKFPLSLVGVGKAVGGVRLDKSTATLYMGKKLKIVPDVYPSQASDKSVKWTSSDTDVLTVSSTGVVTAVSKGTATVTCKTVDGGYTAKCKITVKVAPSEVKLNKTKVTVYTTKYTQLKATVLPKNADDKTVTWASSNTKVARVDSKGKVKAVGAGKAVITAKTNTGACVAKCTVTVKSKVQVSTVTLSKSAISVYKGKGYQLRAAVSPANATFPEVKWSTSNKKVATVSSTGRVTAVGAGKAVITCRSVDSPNVLASCTVTVKIKATGVKLNKTTVSLYEGTTAQLKATVLPSAATNKKVIWKSGNTKAVKIDKNGKITAVKPGKSIITCKTVDGGYYVKCTVIVKKLVKVTSVSLDRTSGAMYQGRSYQFKATVKPSNASIKSLTWSSSNPKVVKVTQKGKIYGVGAGKAVITCKTKQGGKIATCAVTVVPVKVTSVKLNKDGGTMAYGKTYQLVATVYPAEASNKKVTWSSSNPEAVSVSSTGLIKALKPNSYAEITCKTVDGGKIAVCKVKVAPIAATGVKLNKKTANVGINRTTNLIAVVTPSNASNKKVVWGSTNTAVATVDQKGVVTGKSGGTAVIYCKTADGGFVAKCQVTVSGSKVLGVMLDRANYKGSVGSMVTLKATVIPDNASNKNVKWSTTDAAVAIVNDQGKVLCVGTGTCQILACTVDGNYVEACKITVS